MSKFDHHFCDNCWASRQPGRVPTRVTNQPAGTCCACGGKAYGIWVRADPATIACKGEGPNHDEEDQ